MNVCTFSSTIPFKWKATQAYCKQALSHTAWERYIDWYERRDKKCKFDRVGNQQQDIELTNASNTLVPDISQTTASQSSGPVASDSILMQVGSMSPPTTPEKAKKLKA